MTKQVKRLKCPSPALAPYWQNSLKELPSSVFSTLSSMPIDIQPKAVWCSNQLMVMYYPNENGQARLTIRLHEHKQGVLDWDALQQIKTECGFSSYQAFEVYPESRDVVNARDLRHLWLMPKNSKLAIGWIREKNSYNIIEPFVLAKELDTALEQLDVFIKGGQWSSVEKHGLPRTDNKKYIVIYHFHGDKRHHVFMAKYSSLSGFAIPVGAIVTHYYSLLELPKGITA